MTPLPTLREKLPSQPRGTGALPCPFRRTRGGAMSRNTTNTLKVTAAVTAVAAVGGIVARKRRRGHGAARRK
jgi:hypothetical protein